MDLNDLSDEELMKIASGEVPHQQAPQGTRDLTELSDEELQAIVDEPEGPSTKDRVFGAIGEAAKTIDSYTGAPARAAIGAAQDGNNPFSAFADHFGEDPDAAPSGKDIALKAGLSDKRKVIRTAEEQQKFDEMFNPGMAKSRKQAGIGLSDVKTFSPADVGGLAIDVVADPLNVIPVGLAAKGIGKTLGVAADATGAAAKAGYSQVAKAVGKQTAKATAEGASSSRAFAKSGDTVVEQSGKMFDYKAPESLEELRDWKPATNPGELPGKARLEEITAVVPDLETKPLKYHFNMMENPKSMKDLKLTFENLPTQDAKKIAAYNQSIVDESARKIQETVTGISGSDPRHISQAGEDFISTVKELYHTEKDSLGPAFEKMAKTGGKLFRQDSHDLLQAIGSNSKVGKLLSQGEEGRFFLNKNTPKSGMSDAEHAIISRVVDDLNDGMTFKEIQDAREFLRKAIDPSNPSATSEIQKVRSIMLGQLESMGQRHGNDVAGAFKSYAKNERARESIEKIIGGKIESLDAMFAANPDKVVHKIFSNPNFTEIVKGYIGPEKMNGLVQSYIHNGLKKSFDQATGFKPHEVRSWLKKNETFLKHNVDPETVKRLQALADYGYFGRRFLDEVNPSGTAASLKAMIEPQSFMMKVSQQGPIAAVTSEVTNKVGAFTKQKQATKTMNEVLQGKNPTEAKIIDYRKLGYKAGQGAKKIIETAEKGRNVARSVRQIESTDRIIRSADNDKKKGPEKWAEDGFKNLINHSSSAQRQRLEDMKHQLMANQALKKKLISASDLKPGSKAMDKILSEIIKPRTAWDGR